MAQKKIFYPLAGLTRKGSADLFWGEKMKVRLPSGTDIYLTGGRADDAELRLTLFFLLNVKTGDQFLDIGAHYGFYTLLAHHAGASVYALEPSPASFEILQENAAGKHGLQVFQNLAGDSNGQKDFCCFESGYSEYDTVYTEQYANQGWFRHAKRTISLVGCVTTDRFCDTHQFRPDYIKIDTEGSEADIILGATQLLTNASPVIILEYLSPKRGNAPHRKALELLSGLGYSAYMIREDGSLETCADPEDFLKNCGRDSENLVLKKAVSS